MLLCGYYAALTVSWDSQPGSLYYLIFKMVGTLWNRWGYTLYI